MATGAMADGKVYRVGIYMRVAQQGIQTGFHLRDTGLETERAGDAVAAVKDWVDDSFRTILPKSCRVERIDAVNVLTKDFAQNELANYFGTGPDQAGSTTDAALVSLRTAKRQRWLNGRMFWPAMSPGNTIEGLFIGSYLTALNGVATEFMNRFVGNAFTSTFKAVVVTKERPASPTRPALQNIWTDVELLKVSPIMTTQRRRKIGVGS